MSLQFNVHFIDSTTPDDPKIGELKDWCNRFQALNLTPLYKERSLGNLSTRLRSNDDAFIITASALALKENLTNESFTVVHSYDAAKKTLYASGPHEPSSESILHHAIYRMRKDVNAVFHGHSGKILSCANDLNLVTTGKFEEYGSPALVKSVLDILGSESFIIMKDHGFLSLGKTMEEAGTRAVAIFERVQALRMQRTHNNINIS